MSLQSRNMLIIRFLIKTGIVCYSMLHGDIYAHAQTSCTNSDFALGNFNNWIGQIGNCCPVSTSGSGIVPGRHTIMSGNGTDPHSCNQITYVAPGRTYSARLGNSNVGGEAEKLFYPVQVDSAHTILIFRYAVILEDPGHPPAEQPSFSVSITNVQGQVLDTACGLYRVVSGPNIPGFQHCGYSNFRPWTTGALDLSPYFGQLVYVQFMTSDCGYGGHFGYAYIDAECRSANLSQIYCNNSSNAVLSAPLGFSSYSWSNGLSAQSITISNPVPGSIYSCTCNTVTGCQVTFQTTIQAGNPHSDFYAGSTCMSQVEFFNASTSPSQTSVNEWHWSFGDTATSTMQNPVHSYAIPGTYDVTLITGNTIGCTDTMHQNIQVLSLPDVQIQASASDLCIGASATLYASGAFSYSWAPANSLSLAGSNSVVVTPQSNATYLVTGADAHQCIDTATIDISVHALPMILVSASDSSVCDGLSAVLFAQGANSFLWMPGNLSGTTVSVNPSTSVTYSVTGTDSNMCSSSTYLPITVLQNPPIQIHASDTAVCVGGDVQLGSNGNYNFHWMPGNISGDSILIHPITSTTYTLTATDANSCSASAHVAINVYQNPVIQILASKPKVCEGDSLILKASGADAYLWSVDNSTGEEITFTPSRNGYVTVKGVDVHSCMDSSFIRIEIQEKPKHFLGSDTTVCEGSIVHFSSTVKTIKNNWSDGTEAESLSISKPGMYSLQMFDGICTSSDTVELRNFPHTRVYAGNDVEGIFDVPIKLHASGATDYSWSPANDLSCSECPDPVCSPKNSIEYVVTGKDSNACISFDTLLVHIIEDETYFVPNSFTPGTDEKNSFFLLYGLNITEMQMIVYDRFGNKVFESNRQDTGWDGNSLNGSPAKSDAYVYHIHGSWLSGKKFEKVGFVSLIR